MRKLSIRSGLTAAMMAIAGLVQATPAPVQATSNGGSAPVEQPTTQAKNTPSKPVRQNREVLPDGLGGLSFGIYDRGNSPKQYGEMLQSRGKQKWNKRGR